MSLTFYRILIGAKKYVEYGEEEPGGADERREVRVNIRTKYPCNDNQMRRKDGTK